MNTPEEDEQEWMAEADQRYPWPHEDDIDGISELLARAPKSVISRAKAGADDEIASAYMLLHGYIRDGNPGASCPALF